MDLGIGHLCELAVFAALAGSKLISMILSNAAMDDHRDRLLEYSSILWSNWPLKVTAVDGDLAKLTAGSSLVGILQHELQKFRELMNPTSPSGKPARQGALEVIPGDRGAATIGQSRS